MTSVGVRAGDLKDRPSREVSPAASAHARGGDTFTHDSTLARISSQSVQSKNAPFAAPEPPQVALAGPPGRKSIFIDADTMDAIAQESLVKMAQRSMQDGCPFLVAGITAQSGDAKPRHFFAADTLENWGQLNITNPLTRKPVNDVHYWVSHPLTPGNYTYVGAYSDVYPENGGPATRVGCLLSALFNAHRRKPQWLLLASALYEAGTGPLPKEVQWAHRLAARALNGKTPAECSALYKEAIGHAIALRLNAAYDRLHAMEKHNSGDSSLCDSMKELTLAVQRGNDYVVNKLAEHIDINQPITSEVHPDLCQHPTLLMIAAQVGDYPMTRTLLRLGADPTYRDDRGRTAMHYATRDDIRRLLQKTESDRSPRRGASRRTSW